MSVGQHVAQHVDAARRDVKPWVEPAARLGHAAKGLVFMLIGLLAVAARLGIGGDVDGPESAFAVLRGAPLGRVLLATIGIGLLYYAVWELARAIFDPEREANRGLLVRFEWLVTALVFGFVSVAAFRMAFGRAAARGDDVARSWASRVMAELPYGAVVLGVVGAVVVIAGAVLVRRGWRADFERGIDVANLSPTSRRAIYAIARFGIVARGVVLGTIGIFLLVAAWTQNPGEAIGFEGAFHALGSHPSAPWLLAVVALGLASYGVYELVVAWRGRFYLG